MSGQLHNLGYLRMATEDAIVAFFKKSITGATIRPAYTTDKQERSLVVVHAKNTRERNETDYNLARYLDVEVRVLTYAEATKLYTAREAHYSLVAQAYHALSQSDVVTTLNDLQAARVLFWSCYAKTDAGTIEDSSYVSTIDIEIGATPKED